MRTGFTLMERKLLEQELLEQKLRRKDSQRLPDEARARMAECEPMPPRDR